MTYPMLHQVLLLLKHGFLLRKAPVSVGKWLSVLQGKLPLMLSKVSLMQVRCDCVAARERHVYSHFSNFYSYFLL